MQSRNQREGHLDGWAYGRFTRGLRLGKPSQLWSRNSKPLNRKQRKQEKLGGYWSPTFD